MSEEKQRTTPFSGIVVIAVVFLMVLPFITSLNSFLTELLMKWHWYRILQEAVVPYEAKVLAGVLNLLNLSTNATAKGVWVEGSFITIEWNCVGWQSAVFLAASYLSGFQGRFTFMSRMEVVLIGFLGTYLVNFARLIIVAALSEFINTGTAIFFHDYLALLAVIAWFVFFWWFSYSFVLEERGEVRSMNNEV